MSMRIRPICKVYIHMEGRHQAETKTIRTDNMLEKPPSRHCVRRPTTGHLKSMCATDLLHMDTGAPLRSDNEAAHLRLYPQDTQQQRRRRYPQGDGILPADHPWTGYTTLGVCPHAPTAELSQALHQRYVLAAGQADTPPRSMTH
jgi:hypothetical protein